jgi:oxalate decarboxylase
MSVFGSHGRVRSEQFSTGDVGYVPQGYGHYIENSGSEDLDLLIVLNNGTYQSISLTTWVAANPHLLLSTNFRVPESTFANFPTASAYGLLRAYPSPTRRSVSLS